MYDNNGVHIIQTKLNRPVVDSHWLVRPRLISVLDEARDRRLSLISAPAGYGKTTLAVQWLDHISSPAAWLSLDEHDSDPDRFLRYVIATIREIFPRFGLQIEPLLSSPTLPPPEYLADILISDLAEPVTPWVLVFDDFHCIESEHVQMMISRLVQYLPDHLHLIIATRVDPPLPLAQWRAREWLVEIRAADLRFFHKEAKAYLGAPSRGHLSDDLIERINARTEGWVIGLQLARLSLAGTNNPEALARNFSGSDRIVVDFLIDEVISKQPSEIKYFLAVTSVVERFCAPLCDHLLGEEVEIQDSRRLIALLEKENLFLVPLNADGVWYRYHHLFHALLRAKLKTTLPQSRQTQIHHRAGEWFAGRGYIEDALRHLIAAEDLDGAAELVEENIHKTLNQDPSRRVLSRWLDLFPKDAEKRRLILLVAHAYQKMFRWDLTGAKYFLGLAESLLKDPVASIPASTSRNLLGDIVILRAANCFWLGDTENGLRNGHQGLKLVPKKNLYPYFTAIVYTAFCKALSGQKDEALLMLNEALAEDCSEGSPISGQLILAKTAIFSYAADWDSVEKSANRLLDFHKTKPQAYNWLGYAHFLLGNAAYERNLLDDAANHFGCIERMRYLVTTRVYHDALIGLALIACSKADSDSAKSYAEAAFAYAIETGDPLSMQMSDLLQIRLSIFFGNGPIDAAPYVSTADSTWPWLLYPSLNQAENRVNKTVHSDISADLEFIEKGLQMAKYHHNTRLEIQFLAVKAVALKCAGRRNQAIELLEKTLVRAELHGMVRSFVDRGALMAELLLALSKKCSEDGYVKILLDAFGDKVPSENFDVNSAEDPSPSKTPINAFLQSGLSNRELDVVLLLSQRMTNKEIAERLTISTITVKNHTANIYRKLNVHNRRQAVVRAEQLGLLNEYE